MSDSTLKPSHGSIVDTINSAPDASTLAWFGDHIKRTKIPKDHDLIVEAWNAKVNELGLNDDLGVVDSVNAQKQPEAAAA